MSYKQTTKIDLGNGLSIAFDHEPGGWELSVCNSSNKDGTSVTILEEDHPQACQAMQSLVDAFIEDKERNTC